MPNCSCHQCPCVLQAHHSILGNIVVHTLLHLKKDIVIFNTILAPLRDPTPSLVFGSSQSSNITTKRWWRACLKSSKGIQIECVSLLVYKVQEFCVMLWIILSFLLMSNLGCFVQDNEGSNPPHKFVLHVYAEYESARDGNCHYIFKANWICTLWFYHINKLTNMTFWYLGIYIFWSN